MTVPKSYFDQLYRGQIILLYSQLQETDIALYEENIQRKVRNESYATTLDIDLDLKREYSRVIDLKSGKLVEFTDIEVISGDKSFLEQTFAGARKRGLIESEVYPARTYEDCQSLGQYEPKMLFPIAVNGGPIFYTDMDRIIQQYGEDGLERIKAIAASFPEDHRPIFQYPVKLGLSRRTDLKGLDKLDKW